MGNIQVAGRLSKKSIVKDLNGNIINLLDETNGGWIIRNRQIVNPTRYQEMLDEQKARAEANVAQSMQKVDANAPNRNIKANTPIIEPSNLEKRVNDMESKLDLILKAINEKK